MNDTAFKPMTLLRQSLQRAANKLVLNEDLNFLLTNRIPRLALTRFMGWFSQIRQPWVRDASMAAWRLFTDLDLSDARKTRFDSLHDCFTRELKPGARVFDPRAEVLASPCDAVVGACGPVRGLEVFQAKGFPYTLADLFGDEASAAPWRDGRFVTLRLRSSMYHRFHAPHDLRVSRVRHIAGDTWNVNPIALQRVQRLFCKNERAVLHCTLASDGSPIAIVPVAAILVASLRLHFVDALINRQYRGPQEFACATQVSKGQEMGWFQHGSTILVFAPPGFELAPGIATGTEIRAGQALMQRAG
jgi:phosphatidylserine decarboxylase